VPLNKKYQKLLNIISSMDNAIVAYSGGIDSTLLLHAAHQALGSRVTAVTMDTAFIPREELESAKKILSDTGIKLEVIEADILGIKEVSSNPPERCYHCKKEMFIKIRQYAQINNIDNILEGSNHDDMDDFRPGAMALKELGISSPLKEAVLTKKEIRSIARDMGLTNWNKPAAPCLATRFPYGTAIEKDELIKIENAERFLHGLKIDNVRVRHHGRIARIEVTVDKMPILIEEKMSRMIAEKFKKIGFTYVTLDIEGYRMGSMNEEL